MTDRPMFHFSLAVDDLDRARDFYGKVMGCPEGRKVPGRADFNFYGHHVVTHLAPTEVVGFEGRTVGEAKATPLRHFGLIVPMDQFDEISAKLEAGQAKILTGPKTIGKGEPREQRVIVCTDGCGNALEFKGLPVVDRIFEPVVSPH